MAKQREAVHLAGNQSDTDRFGCITRFRVGTMCGIRLGVPRLLTQDRRRVTCARCRRWIQMVRAS